MSKRLHLLRHAKSSWKEPELADHDRPLSGRGRRAADVMARHLRESAVKPELVLCSTARRARQTWERIEPSLAGTPVRYDPELYGASAASLLERVRGVPDDVASVLLIGHNPAIEVLACELACPSALLDDLAAKFPTGALATLDVPAASWRGLGDDCAELVAFVRPRDVRSG
jgi:phosphohistidine phosphatase